MLNSLNVFISRRRWLKRLIHSWMNDSAKLTFNDGFIFHYNPKDLYGPSFHVAYGQEYGFNSYEKEDKQLVLDNVPANGNFIDIGANVGLFTLFVKRNRPDINIKCFEPDPISFNCLSASIADNHFEGIELNQSAIGSEKGSFKLYTSAINAGGHSLVLSGEDKKGDIFVEVEVAPLLCFDSKNPETKVHFIKIDVEGAELSVLNGAIELIKKSRPTVLVECSLEDLSSGGDVFKFFESHFRDANFIFPTIKTLLSINEIAQNALKLKNEGKVLANILIKFK